MLILTIDVEKRGGVAADNVFNLPTNQQWKNRRQSFRHAFTNAALQALEDRMSALVDKLHEKILTFVENQSILKLDQLFGQFTLDTLYDLGFEFSKDFLNHEDEYLVSAHAR